MPTNPKPKHKNRNRYESTPDPLVMLLIIRRRDNSKVIVKFDTADFGLVQGRLWRAHECPSMQVVTGAEYHITLGRFLLDPPDGKIVAHVSDDVLDCRRSNLYVTTRGELSGRMAPNRRIGVSGERYITRSGNGYKIQGYINSVAQHIGWSKSLAGAVVMRDEWLAGER